MNTLVAVIPPQVMDHRPALAATLPPSRLPVLHASTAQSAIP